MVCYLQPSCLQSSTIICMKRRSNSGIISLPSSIVPSRGSVLDKGLGTLWLGAYSTVQRYCTPRSVTKECPCTAALNAPTSEGLAKLTKAALCTTRFVLHSKICQSAGASLEVDETRRQACSETLWRLLTLPVAVETQEFLHSCTASAVQTPPHRTQSPSVLASSIGAKFGCTTETDVLLPGTTASKSLIVVPQALCQVLLHRFVTWCVSHRQAFQKAQDAPVSALQLSACPRPRREVLPVLALSEIEPGDFVLELLVYQLTSFAFLQ